MNTPVCLIVCMFVYVLSCFCSVLVLYCTVQRFVISVFTTIFHSLNLFDQYSQAYYSGSYSLVSLMLLYILIVFIIKSKIPIKYKNQKKSIESINKAMHMWLSIHIWIQGIDLIKSKYLTKYIPCFKFNQWTKDTLNR